MTHFPPTLRTASVVQRWGVIQTLKPDPVASHSYYVTMYAQTVAKLINWRQGQGPGGYTDNFDFEAGFYLTQYALAHDLDEIFTGDTVTFIKSEILDQQRTAQYVASQMQTHMPPVGAVLAGIAALPYADDIKKIVKVADWLDALFFSINEVRMGNSAIAKYEPYTIDKLKGAWFKLPCDKNRLLSLWNNEIQAAIGHHRDD